MGPRLRILLALGGGLGLFFLLWLALSWPAWISGLLAVGAYLGLVLLSKPQLKIGSIRVDRLPDGDALKKLLLEAESDMEELRQAGSEISNPEIRRQSEKLYKTGVQILKYLEKNPERIPAARRFFNYYLSTAVGILRKYLPFQKSGLAAAEVAKVTRSTEKAMPILNKAFEKQFVKLMQNDILDIESDIKVLELNLKSEGGLDSDE